MKPLYRLIALIILVPLTGFAAPVESPWHRICSEKNAPCRSIWAQKTLPEKQANILFAYNVTPQKKGPAKTLITVQLNNIQVDPEQKDILVGNGTTHMALPIVAIDEDGSQAALAGANKSNQLIHSLLARENSKLTIVFKEAGQTDKTRVTIPLTGFAEQLKYIPHGDALFSNKK